MNLEQPLNPLDSGALFEKGGVENRRNFLENKRREREQRDQEEASTIQKLKDRINRLFGK